MGAFMSMERASCAPLPKANNGTEEPVEAENELNENQNQKMNNKPNLFEPKPKMTNRQKNLGTQPNLFEPNPVVPKKRNNINRNANRKTNSNMPRNTNKNRNNNANLGKNYKSAANEALATEPEFQNAKSNSIIPTPPPIPELPEGTQDPGIPPLPANTAAVPVPSQALPPSPGTQEGGKQKERKSRRANRKNRKSRKNSRK
jgi:hypothetical protein